MYVPDLAFIFMCADSDLKIQRQEDDVRSRMSNATDAYRKAVTDTQTMRQEYFNFQLPRILRVRAKSPLLVNLD